MTRVLFVQRRAHRAGAQTCLMRLLRHPSVRRLEPVLLSGEEGWLTQACGRDGVRWMVEPFPSSRSFGARLLGNRAFAARVARRIAAGQPALVHGNDHLEGLLTLELGRALRAKTALFLRSPTMSAEDFAKYGCAKVDLLAAVGRELQQFDTRTLLIPDGLEPAEFLLPKPVPTAFPRRVLVIGSEVAWKGWGDAVELLDALRGAGMPMQADFTGRNPGLTAGNHLRFLGRVEAFKDLVRQYDLVINPSWHESFGMAALEVLAAGVPIFSTRSGVIEDVVTDARYLAHPRAVGEMSEKLLGLAAAWPGSALDVAACQARIRERFTIDHVARRLCAAYASLFPGQHWPEGLPDARIAQ